jgi:hypothetical protein
LLYGGVDREDVLNSIVCSVRHLGKETEPEPDNLVVNALRANAFSESDLMTWEADPIGTCERLFPGSTYLVEKYGMDIKHKPHVIELGEGASTVGFEPKIHFGTFLDQLRALDSEGGEAAVRAISCGY